MYFSNGKCVYKGSTHFGKEKVEHKNIDIIKYKNELNDFCINNCPHKETSCKSRPCHEFVQYRRQLKRKYNVAKNA